MCGRGAFEADRQRRRWRKKRIKLRGLGDIWVLLGLNGWYTGPETRLFQVSRQRLRLTSYAALRTRSSDRSSSRPGLSIAVLPGPSAGGGGGGGGDERGRLPVRGHVLAASAEAPNRDN